MQAIILVGGEGTRLRPLTYTTPKQMLPIVGRPMLEWVFAHLRRHGIDEVILSLGYLPDAFAEAYPEGEINGVRLRYAVEPERLDTAGAIRFAARSAGVADTFVVLNGDVLTDLNVTELVDFHRANGALGTLALHEVEDPSAFGVVPTDPRGRVLEFVEKPAPGSAPTNRINAGTYVLEPAVLELIPEGRRVSVERETFPLLVEQGLLYAAPGNCYWLDAGTPIAFLQAHFDVLDRVRGSEDFITATYDAECWREVDAELQGDASGNTYLATGSTVARGARVEHSMVGANVVVAPGATVIDSVLLAGAHVGAGAVVEHSIVGPRGVVGDAAELHALSVVGAGIEVPNGVVLFAERLPA